MSNKKDSEWGSVKKLFAKKSKTTFSRKGCMYAVADSRDMLRYVPDSSIDCIVTSPPYGSLKNYGSKTQLGYGQNTFDEYFPDLQKILAESYRIAKDGAPLWLILDNMKENGKGIPLPWEVMNRAVEAGWSFHDIVVWDKGRSLPWSHNGKFRGVCEYIILLGKGKLKRFNLHAARDTDHLSWYWVKYPERYHPDGKAPSDLWHFPIPLQGSWSNGKKQSRHFCPFPLDLVARILNISTVEKDIVLDPFAGTGSVIATASYMDRYGIGIDINQDYFEEYKENGCEAYLARAEEVIPKKVKDKKILRKTIINLRMLKYAKALFSQLSRSDRLNSQARERIGLFVVSLKKYNKINCDEVDTLNLGSIEVDILLPYGVLKKDSLDLLEVAKELTKIPPLSKYGLNVEIRAVSSRSYSQKTYAKNIGKGPWYLYRNAAFYKYVDSVNNSRDIVRFIQDEVENNKYKAPAIISNIKADVELPLSD